MKLKRTENYGLTITDTDGNVVSAGTTNIPDIHLYPDWSGSSGENDHEPWVRSAIRLAKYFGVKLYVNSFSDCLSDCSELDLDGKSEEQVYDDYLAIKKVSGGTNLEQIWRYINQSEQRTAELSLVITDFEWVPTENYAKYPANLYYVPFATNSESRKKSLTYWAENFMRIIGAIDPDSIHRVLL